MPPQSSVWWVEGLVHALHILANIYDNVTFIEPQKELHDRLFPIVPKASLLLLPPILVPPEPTTGAREGPAPRERSSCF